MNDAPLYNLTLLPRSGAVTWGIDEFAERKWTWVAQLFPLLGDSYLKKINKLLFSTLTVFVELSHCSIIFSVLFQLGDSLVSQLFHTQAGNRSGDLLSSQQLPKRLSLIVSNTWGLLPGPHFLSETRLITWLSFGICRPGPCVKEQIPIPTSLSRDLDELSPVHEWNEEGDQPHSVHFFFSSPFVTAAAAATTYSLAQAPTVESLQVNANLVCFLPLLKFLKAKTFWCKS